MDEFEEVLPRRALTNGKWDKVLKAKMVELSEADNYDDAKDEWITTGNCWYIPWADSGIESLPEHHHTHPHSCLCGHKIVWHFEIYNTVTDVYEIVGSDHINSYMVIRHLVEEKGIKPETITDEMIDEWITEQVKGLKAKWWWDLNGDQFTEWFESIRELDLRVNVRKTKRYYNYLNRTWDYKTAIRKRAEGKFGQQGYKMSSIVWRWNHPDNRKRQIETRGYPNDRLWNDLQIFYITRQTYLDIIAKEDKKKQLLEEERENRRKDIERERAVELEEQREYKKQQLLRIEKRDTEEAELDGILEQKRIETIMAARINAEEDDTTFGEMCAYYDVPVFDISFANSRWQERFITDIIIRLSQGKGLSDKQLVHLRKIVVDEPLPATNKQIWYIKKLSPDYEMPVKLTRVQASDIINTLKGEDE